MQKRSPIITVMGHVDHGKTTLLDYVRKANIAAREAGGITQSIGAYEIEHKGTRVTFIDTPGHEAFTKMRTRGAHVADVAILVVAADDGVKPQTKEAIDILQKSKTPFVVAITKIDTAGANPEKAKNDLLQAGVYLEGMGGDVSFQPISSKTGEGVDELIDLVLLAAELEDLDYDPSAPASGFILESKRDSKRGVVVTGIVENGTLTAGDTVATPTAGGKLKSIENFLGKRIEKAEPSSPVLMIGFDDLPKIGETFTIGATVPEKAGRKQVIMKKKADGDTAIRLMLKADVSGSLEALSQIIRAIPLPETYILEILDESIGDITDGDIKNADAASAMIIGFNTKMNKSAENLAKAQNVRIIASKVIYEIVDELKKYIAIIRGEIITGDLEILGVFGKKEGQQIVGGKTVKGEILNHSVVKIKRNDAILGEGRIINTQSMRKDVPAITEGNEGGLLIESRVEIAVGDHLIV